MQAGEIVLKRSICRGNVRWCFPHRYVGAWPTGFEDRRPPDSWGPLGPPRDWHVV